MKEIFTSRFVFRITFCTAIILGGFASHAQNCYRTYVHLIADPSYYAKNGSNRTTTEQAMVRAINDARAMYRQLGIEFFIVSKQVFTSDRPVSNPFYNITTSTGTINKMRDLFPDTYGNSSQENNPYETGQPRGFVYDMYILFMDKVVDPGQDPGRGIFGRASSVGGFYGTNAYAFATQRASEKEMIPVGELPDGTVILGPSGRILEIRRTDAQMRQTIAHEIGHLFGADHDGGTNCTTIMCQGGNRQYSFSTASRNAINSRLANHRDRSCTGSAIARMAAANFYDEPLSHETSDISVTVSPNPTSGMATVHFNQKVKGMVTLTVYNSIGQAVTTITPEEEFDEGIHQLEADLRGQQPGLYVFDLKAANLREKIRVSLE